MRTRGMVVALGLVVGSGSLAGCRGPSGSTRPVAPIRPEGSATTESGRTTATPVEKPKPALGGNLVVGSPAPAGRVTCDDGQSYELSKAWADGTGVLIFYRGHWCPHCRKQLGELKFSEGKLASRHATLMAISADPIEDARALKAKVGAGYLVCSDPSLAVIAAWGLQDPGAPIAKPTTVVIGKDGTIRYLHVGDTPADRPTPEQLLTAVDSAATQ
jgi:peroxiredoxin